MPTDKWQGMLSFPWSYGVVLTRITRKQFETAELHYAIEPHRVICSDEMMEAVEPEELQSRLWGMFPTMMRGVLSLPQIDRVRWILFPEVRGARSIGLFAQDEQDDERLPDLMRVMDLQQEQLARSLGDGHCVIHGVAGSRGIYDDPRLPRGASLRRPRGQPSRSLSFATTNRWR